MCVPNCVCLPTCLLARRPVLNLQLVKRGGMWDGLFFFGPCAAVKKVGFGRGEDSESG